MFIDGSLLVNQQASSGAACVCYYDRRSHISTCRPNEANALTKWLICLIDSIELLVGEKSGAPTQAGECAKNPLRAGLFPVPR